MPEAKGVLVAEVTDDSPSAKAKLERGDVITAYNGVMLGDPVHLRMLVTDTMSG